MTSPILRRIGHVFIPVSDMRRAIAWYSRLLNLPITATSHAGNIYDLPMEGETGLILDAHKPVTNSSQPLFYFWTDDIEEALRFLQGLSVEIVSAIDDIGTVSTLTFRDPDRNLLMVCQRNER